VASQPIEEAIEDIRRRRMVVVCDDENRENEGDLDDGGAVRDARGDQLHGQGGRGLICLALDAERCDELGLDLMAAKNESPFETAFTVSSRPARASPPDLGRRPRAHDPGGDRPASQPRDLVQPGHVFPLKAKAGGVLERTGQTEAAVDLARLAGLIPAA
jgi:3,4-dihydroxy 2-butanone 4-phosphate synthase/GTP cyclohydrolase II